MSNEKDKIEVVLSQITEEPQYYSRGNEKEQEVNIEHQHN